MTKSNPQTAIALIQKDILLGNTTLVKSPILNSLVKSVFFKMFTMVGKKLQVFYSIIKSVAVYMVNDLAFGQKSFKFLFHYKSVFTNISTFIGCRRMMGLPNTNISFTVNNFSPLVMMSSRISTFVRTVFKSNVLITSEHFATIKTWNTNKRKLSFTFSRAKDALVGRITSKFLFAVGTGIGNHQCPFYNMEVKESIW